MHWRKSVTYVVDLEIRIKWLESIIQEHVPSIDLTVGPGQSHGDWNPPQHTQQGHEIRDIESSSEITDQIGLISITTGTDLRYLGPSSGLFFIKFVLAGLGKRVYAGENTTASVKAATDTLAVPSYPLIPQPKELPSDHRHTRWLSQAYFDIVHLQFPILHERSQWEIVEKIYADAEFTVVHKFQVLMVIAIGASILSRRTKVMLSAEGYFASAMKLVDGVMRTSLEPLDSSSLRAGTSNGARPAPERARDPIGKASSFDAIFYPGGHGPMFDIVNDRDSLTLIEEFYTAGKPVAAVCHGPIVFVNAITVNGKPLLQGRRATGFSNAEENAAGLTGAMPALLEDEIKRVGGTYVQADHLWKEMVVVDGQIITGQNPTSAQGVGVALATAVGKYDLLNPLAVWALTWTHWE
ncbi:class I glutamine amidotransferase-like protein [Aspergillus stella-maris]|uniref:class I glutamine amidotransferase-like protein n=1 Tax=Aspergillus stella-maris TaxID=1810926 RepID=UPI003CCCDC41